MVKVQKPNPKSIKKTVPNNKKSLKSEIKRSELTSEEKSKKIKKTLETSKIKIAKNIEQQSADSNKKSDKVKEKVKKDVIQKNPIAAEVQKELTKPARKKKQINVVVNKKLKNSEKKNAITSKVGNNQAIDSENKKAKKKPDRNSKLDAKEHTFEPSDFDKEKFKDVVNLENIKRLSSALKVLVEKEASEKKTLIFSDYRYFLNISSYKIPNCPKRMVKLNLKHSLVNTKTDDVVLVVPDLQRGAKVDYEPTIQHYKDLLREIGFENIKIVPFNQLRNEYASFESKRKFASAYDYFLCDGRIVGHVVGFCGKFFQKPRTTFHAVSLHNPRMCKNEIERALKRTSYRQLQKGDMISIPVGTHLFTVNQIAENIEAVINQLETIFPGGYANIRNIYLKIDIKGTSSLPLYVSLAGAPAEVPNVIGPREQAMIRLKKKANDILSNFNMSKTGEFVKLNKTQVKRKLQFRETRKVLLSEGKDIDANNSELNQPLKKKFKSDSEGC